MEGHRLTICGFFGFFGCLPVACGQCIGWLGEGGGVKNPNTPALI